MNELNNMNQSNNQNNLDSNNNMSQNNTMISGNQQQTQENNYASVGDRIVAYIIDNLIIIGISFLVYMILFTIQFVLLAANVGSEQYSGFSLIIAYIMMFIIIFGYPIKCYFGLVSEKHATGAQSKRGIYFSKLNGYPMSKGEAAFRCILMVLLLRFSLLSLATMLITDKGQTLYDLILGHVALSKKQK